MAVPPARGQGVPHYHYVYQEEKAQRRVFLDPFLEGDVQRWTPDLLRTRLPHLLDQAGDHFDELGTLETEVKRGRDALGVETP